MLRGSLASLLLLLLATWLPRAILAERPSSRNLLAADAVAGHEDMADGELQRLEGELVDMQRRVHAVQQQRASSQASTGPTSVQRSSSAAMASALGQAAASASSGSEVSETQVLKHALDVAVQALVDKAMQPSPAPVSKDKAATPEDTVPPEAVTVAEEKAPEKKKQVKKIVDAPDWAKELNLKVNKSWVPDEPDFNKVEEPKPEAPQFKGDIPAFEFNTILNPVWKKIDKESSQAKANAEAAINLAKSLNKVPDAVDKKVKDMHAFVDRAKQAYVDQTKETIQHVKKKPDEALQELRQDSPLELDNDLAFEEGVDMGLSGGLGGEASANVQEGYSAQEYGEVPANGAL